ncbi:hypothetical protein [Marinifilum sp. D737]|uniref:hypothetical protein n=1 Tax=Marinifilum sp. D737 TaxID=2969628 RepID=UPI002273B470|nr:hypothetical protein [Marinifilum sp. D737]MCY1634977.1 hypothetical protein [Marinifilum sp. D737]
MLRNFHMQISMYFGVRFIIDYENASDIKSRIFKLAKGRYVGSVSVFNYYLDSIRQTT